MVLIDLKAQYVSLVITVLSGAAELCLFAAALGLNRYAECHALKRGKQLSVRRHRLRTKFLAVFAMLVFIVLEVVASFFSNPHVSTDTEERACLAVDRYDVNARDPFGFRTDSIMFACLKNENDRFFQHVGNRSLPQSGRDAVVTCEESPLYTIVGEGAINASIGANASRSCTTGAPPNSAMCAFTELRGRELRFSRFLFAEDADAYFQNGTQVPFLVTFLSFDLEPDQQDVLAKRAIDAFSASISDPFELRRRILTGAEQTTCPFLLSDEPDETEVPLALVYVIVSCWVLSVLLFAATLLFRRQLFYDMGDPLHWAQRTFRHVDEPFAENPVVSSVYEHGERLMYVSSSSSDEFGFLRSVKTRVLGGWKGGKKDVSDASVEEQSV